MTATAALLLVVGALLVLAALAVALSREARVTALVYPAAAVMSATGFLVALAALLGNASSQLVLPLGLPWIGAHFRVDALSAFFLAVVNLGGLAASVYAVGYGRHEEAPHRVLPFYPAFLAGMNLVVLAADAFSFLLAWEFMSLASWAMVLAHHRDAQNRRAATVYLVMASFGTMALLLAFGLLAGAGGDYTFAAIRAADRAPLTASLALLFVLVGAGSKAGLVPLHVWLPLAHPAAPSHVSALMSGVMTKVAVYGFIRIVFDLVGEPAWWTAVLLLVLGGGTAVLGILHALMERDLKRLLAYSTIENIGIVFASLGLALAFRANAMEWAAALALTAALFHVLNHAGADCGAVPRLQPRAVQEPAVLRRRRGADRDRAARPRPAGRADPPHAGDGGVLPRRLRRHLGAAALQRLRLGMADLPGDPAKSADRGLGPEDRRSRRRRHAGADRRTGRGLLRARLRRRLPRPRPLAGGRRGRRGRPLLARGDGRAGASVPCRRHAAGLRDRRAGAGFAASRRRRDAGAGGPAVAVHRADRRKPLVL